MSQAYFGASFDIHGGGADLIFPHHENEIAQSTCANGPGTFARVWMHNGFLMVEGEKMSKSLGNFLVVHDLLKEFPGEALRLALLATHYRQPLDFTRAGVEQAKRTLDRWYLAAANSTPGAVPDAVMAALEDDLNTPQAVAELHKLADAAFTGDAKAPAALRAGAYLLGLLAGDRAAWRHWRPAAAGLADADIEALIEKRNAARQARDFARADAIRKELLEKGVALEDGAKGTTWRRA
jgi:cysteinyl-tRNA synthetase